MSGLDWFLQSALAPLASTGTTVKGDSSHFAAQSCSNSDALFWASLSGCGKRVRLPTQEAGSIPDPGRSKCRAAKPLHPDTKPGSRAWLAATTEAPTPESPSLAAREANVSRSEHH